MVEVVLGLRNSQQEEWLLLSLPSVVWGSWDSVGDWICLWVSSCFLSLFVPPSWLLSVVIGVLAGLLCMTLEP